MSLQLIKKTVSFLEQRKDQKFTARQIAKWIVLTYPKETADLQKRRSSPLAKTDMTSLIAYDLASIRKYLQKREPKIETTEERPRRYYYTTQSDQSEVEIVEAGPNASMSPHGDTSKFSEHDLYAKLKEFLWSEYGIYPQRIDEKRSSQSHGPGGNRWLYPDVVAVENLTTDWHREVIDCVQEKSGQKTKVWSFEVKIKIDRSNVREAFFQAVSNSSWANYGYLVAAVLIGGDARKELDMLSARHGIGFIQLDFKNPAESNILIPAKEKDNIDWDAANRLFKENKDFKNFIDKVIIFHKTGKIRPKDWGIEEIEGDV